MDEILKQDISLTLGLINENNNQYENAKEKEEVVQGDANMLMRMI